jgi:DNA-binding CsgD family transcriptional regulator
VNGYWKAIIQEVVNKEKSTHPLRLTNTAIPQDYDDHIERPIKIIQRYYLNEPYQQVYFTYQEARCLLHCKRNSRYKAISQALNISERTVEFYLKNMREKLKCKTKKDLLKVTEKGEFFKKYKLAGSTIERYEEPTSNSTT